MLSGPSSLAPRCKLTCPAQRDGRRESCECGGMGVYEEELAERMRLEKHPYGPNCNRYCWLDGPCPAWAVG